MVDQKMYCSKKCESLKSKHILCKYVTVVAESLIH